MEVLLARLEVQGNLFKIMRIFDIFIWETVEQMHAHVKIRKVLYFRFEYFIVALYLSI